MKISMPQRKSTRIEMLPLIDVVFLLLVVFIYAMLSMAVHRGMPVVLPQSNQTETVKSESVSITIKADGQLFLDRQRVSMEQLSQMLRPAAARKKPPTVLIFADQTLDYQHLFSVLDRIRETGLQQISLQAQMEADE